MKAFKILVTFLVMTQFAIGQTNSETKIVIQISPVYQSGLVSYDPSCYLLISRNFDENFRTDLFFASLTKKKFWKQSDLIDSISKDFKIYSIGFDSTHKQMQKLFNDRNNFGNSFLISLAPEVSGVKAYLITLFAKRIRKLQYQVVKSDCDIHWDDCEVKISDINF
jgi:hypothetical protein